VEVELSAEECYARAIDMDTSLFSRRAPCVHRANSSDGEEELSAEECYARAMDMDLAFCSWVHPPPPHHRANSREEVVELSATECYARAAALDPSCGLVHKRWADIITLSRCGCMRERLRAYRHSVVRIEVDASGVITISRGCFERCGSNKNSPINSPYLF